MSARLAASLCGGYLRDLKKKCYVILRNAQITPFRRAIKGLGTVELLFVKIISSKDACTYL